MAFDHLDDGKFADERAALAALLATPPLGRRDRDAVQGEAEALVRAARKAAGRQGVVESFLQEFSLSTREGLALMCLAEALLRTPDEETRDRLIAEKIASADWASHAGKSDSVLVNASTWSLMLTGRLIDPDEDARRDLPGFVRRLAGRLGEPVIRRAVGAAVRIMGEQFVLGATIDRALRRATSEGFVCSFDMLGEGARTDADADRYEAAYAQAIRAVGRHASGQGPERGHGVSVKLSALSPRYEARQAERVFGDLYPRLVRLAVLAAEADINLTLDAEEADRLVLSLELLDRLAREPALDGQALGAWRGLGLAVQAYQKRGVQVIEAVAGIARAAGRRLMVRLVKGAYWDSEIKRAQTAGLPGYPVFTTKAATDVSYLACARALLAAAPHLYGQFATHNAHTLAAVRLMASQMGLSPEFQRLHGMGEALYAAAHERYGAFPLRVYAPVGSHEDLLPYLVRRLLENGANTSFVHALLDEKTPVERVVVDPVAAVEAAGAGPHPRIPLPRDLYGPARRNSEGLDLSVAAVRRSLAVAVGGLGPLEGAPIVSGRLCTEGVAQDAVDPSDTSRVIGRTWPSTPAHIDAAFAAARAAQPAWDQRGGEDRARILRAVADALEAARERLIAVCVREAGKTLADAVAEVREAADFCRYYALLAERQFGAPETLRGPVGETNRLELRGRGVFVCISPWNFPLAIFTGQVAAALAAGNGVLAKPAEQTPIVATEAVKLFHAAGVPADLLHLLPGDGATVGAALTAHPGCDGVAFTGGTDTAWAINRALAARDGPIVPFIAETGGLNAMFVDTTALREQVIDDVLASAFGSAGQRCSALRMLFLPHETADALIEGLTGAMQALVVGDPADPRTDVGPVIDAEARAALDAHLRRLETEARVLARLDAPAGGHAFPPVLAEIPDAAFLQKEVFGPILHVVRYDPARLAQAAAPLVATRYGLTLGVHSRIEAFAEEVRRTVPAGNAYVNRSMIGAVVGVQPFGGEGLSGTGPKAGGPHALHRYAVERALSINIAAQGGDPALLNLEG
ncbi:bifunctional proline dehydrogenase/L-glutamate gamma-semialdehyde dehydrogenase PutA [Phenylobacterium sp. SCN 70-31]|uniref:bifunctional proline dehydrogenase/L-glutamate gamma-semialdehyde dehydrogenase PutA n=1 Tax=Phenylobacterium sp. SCN 70-31 TaxID=1660129 RepID=UPI00086F6B44|nr:bifunctional proline dehydrogenase/L-glutamate gamma-semialdehyde dehydrogenase PutA [Phenylobacterium sp. SCN 70-31]ODT84521.1 MAG: bifunctional proline dehydrogenase/L-glutamate gamma-semialdehyde dehydrogenase [Phenylobacterium sp. SCN 70-31]